MHDTEIVQHFLLESDSWNSLKNAIDLIFDGFSEWQTSKVIVGYVEENRNTLYLLLYDDAIQEKKKAVYHKLLFPLTKDNTFSFIKDWLNNVPFADRLCDIPYELDGSYDLGFRMSQGWEYIHNDADRLSCYDFQIAFKIEAHELYYSK